MRGVSTLLIVGALTCATAAGGRPEQAPSDIATLTKRIDQLERSVDQLRAIVAGLASRPSSEFAKPPASPLGRLVDIQGAPTLGDSGAQVAIVEYADFACPFCRRYFVETMPSIREKYIATGRVKYVFKHLPMEDIHPLARRAARAAECANEQNKFWSLHDLLLANQPQLTPAMIESQVEKLGLDDAAFTKCSTANVNNDRVQADADQAQELAIVGTPSFVIGQTTADGRAVTVRALIIGAKPFELFQAELERVLREHRQN